MSKLTSQMIRKVINDKLDAERAEYRKYLTSEHNTESNHLDRAETLVLCVKHETAMAVMGIEFAPDALIAELQNGCLVRLMILLEHIEADEQRDAKIESEVRRG